MSNNLTCAAVAELNRLASLNFILFQFVDLTTAAITFIFTYFAAKVLFKWSIFQSSTKILLVLNLLYAVMYQFTYGIEAVIIIYKHFYKKDSPCELLQLESDCAFSMKSLLCCTSGMIYCQTGLILERTFATFLRDYKGTKSLIVGSSIAVIVLLLSALTGPIIYWDDPLSGAILACFVFPKQSATRSTVYFFVVTGITLFNLATSISLNKYNAKLEYQVRFKLCARFHKREIIESTGTVCFLTFAQFFLMFIYSLGISILKSIRNMITPEQYYHWVVWLYTVPFIAMLFPILLTYSISKTKSHRSQILVGITTTKQTQEEHIAQMKVMWK
ncbi:unnamed protein product [Caenorhabditis brenneri]